ncbi:MAG: hypothetical protein HQ486_03375 [Acidimicrobiaceae bacterium]|nr:hypothetical protein [Acidimicrobiaceae bacterium]
MSTSGDDGSRIDRVRLCALVSSQLNGLNQKPVELDSPVQFDSTVEFGSAVGVIRDGTAWVLLTDRHDRGLGPALLWATHHLASALRVFTDEYADDLARRASFFNFDIKIYDVSSNTPVLTAPNTVEIREISFADELFADFITTAGADLTREHGVLAGEVCGLEVCRVVHDELGESRLEIGVGAHDRQIFQLLHGRTASIESLRKVVHEVASKRVVNANPHPLNQLGRERLLRHLLCASPELIDAVSLEPVPPPSPRANLRDPVPCCARGISSNGDVLVAIFSIGVDPDVVTFGADARQQINPTADLIFVSPPRDAVPPIVQLAKLLYRPSRFCDVNLLDV